jgi:hypothetical protein
MCTEVVGEHPNISNASEKKLEKKKEKGNLPEERNFLWTRPNRLG